MEFEQRYSVAMPDTALWLTLNDVHKVADCLSGVEELEVVSDDHYEGRLAVKMGPVNLRFQGTVRVTCRDEDTRRGVLEATAKDPRAGGGFKASLTMQIIETETDSADLMLHLHTTFLGRIGELGRPLIKKKITTMMDDFVATLNDRYGTTAAPEQT